MSNLFGGGAKTASTTPTQAMGIQFNSSQYGPPVTVQYGTGKLGGSCLWYGDFKSHSSSQKVGKGGGSTTTGYTYSASFMLGLCEGPIQGVRNVYSGTSTVSLSSVGAVIATGTQGQAAWSHLSGGFALGYSQTAWVAVANLNLGSSASLPDWNPEVQGLLIHAGSDDANPADILTDICTNTTHGINFPWLGSLTQYSNYCLATGLLLSPTYDQEQTAQQTLEDLFKYTNTAAWFSEGVLKTQPYGDTTVTGNGVTYTPNLTPLFDLGEADYIVQSGRPPITITRKSPADCMNMVRVEFQDRTNTYHSSVVIASIDQDVVQHGGRADTTESVDMCKLASVARFIAQNLVQQDYYIRNTYEFKLSWRYCMLEPMDIVTLTDANTGLNLAPVRITEVSEDESGVLSITAEEFPEGVGHSALYNTQPNNGGTIDPNSDPGAVNPPYLFRGPGFLVSNSTPEIWCAVNGANALWGGAEVWLSHDGTSYNYMGTIAQPARYGALATSLPSGSDPDTTNTPEVTLYQNAQLLGGSQADANNLNTLSMVDTELMSYETATLVSGETYQLSYLRRGAYGSAIAAHIAGAPWVRLDDAIFRIPVDPSLIGTTVYVKFLSLNVFGRTPRTLASETAYSYVVGSNVELPDVPPVPASFATAGVADGVSITWNNSNPAAVGCTSIERSTTSSGPWTVLAQVGPTTTGYTDHFTNGATYYYRARARGPLVQSGWSAYTSTFNSTGTNVSLISQIATQAQGQANNIPVINGGFDIMPAGYGWTSDPSSNPWFVDTTGITPGAGTNCARYNGNGTLTTLAYRNNGYVPCQAGQVYKAQGLIKGTGSPNGTAFVYVSWLNSALSEIGTTVGNQIAGNTTAPSFAVGAAPAGTTYARTCLGVANNSTGTYLIDNVLCTQYPTSLDEVPDSSTYARQSVRVKELLDNGDFEASTSIIPPPGWTTSSVLIVAPTSLTYYTGSPYSGSQCLNVAGPQFAGVQALAALPVNAGEVYRLSGAMNYVSGPSGGYATIIVFFVNYAGTIVSSAGITTVGTGNGLWKYATTNMTVPTGGVTAYVVARVDGAAGTANGLFDTISMSRAASMDTEVIDGTTYGRTSQNDLYSSGGVNRIGLRIAGSGQRIGDQRNLTAVTFSNFGSGWSGLALSYSSTSTSATISASAATLQAGSVAINYNASSVTVSGTAGTNVTYYLYYNDPNHAGGAQTLSATTSQITALSNDGFVYLGTAAVSFPTSGTGSGGGGGLCPLRKAWVIKRGKGGKRQFIRAGQVRVGDLLLLCNGAWGEVTYSQAALTECVRLISTRGTLGCSTTAPIKTYRSVTAAMECAGKDAMVLSGKAMYARIEQTLPIGKEWVQHITCQNDFFWTGDSKDCLFAHHNIKPP